MSETITLTLPDSVSNKHERKELASLQSEADLVMRRKARAAVLLRFRDNRLSTVAELDQQCGTMRMTLTPSLSSVEQFSLNR